MRFTTLGKTGITVSKICLGCMSYGTADLPDWAGGTKGWHLDLDASREHFKLAIDSGINFFDTADVYCVGQSEEIVGQHLQDMARRDEIVLATKVWGAMGPSQNERGLSRKHIIEGCEKSLKRLQTDFIDLYQIHRFDPKTDIEDTLDALDTLITQGKVRYIGASSMAAWQFCKMLHTQKANGWRSFVTMQNHYNLVYREEEREMIPLCMDQGIGIIPWSPMARGFLTGSRTREGGATTQRAKVDDFATNMYFTDADFAVAEAVRIVAEVRGVKMAQVALSWVMNGAGVTSPIVGATKLEHLKEAIAAVDIELTKEEVAALEDPYQPHTILGHLQPTPRSILGLETPTRLKKK